MYLFLKFLFLVAHRNKNVSVKLWLLLATARSFRSHRIIRDPKTREACEKHQQGI